MNSQEIKDFIHKNKLSYDFVYTVITKTRRECHASLKSLTLEIDDTIPDDYNYTHHEGCYVDAFGKPIDKYSKIYNLKSSHYRHSELIIRFRKNTSTFYHWITSKEYQNYYNLCKTPLLRVKLLNPKRLNLVTDGDIVIVDFENLHKALYMLLVSHTETEAILHII